MKRTRARQMVQDNLKLLGGLGGASDHVSLTFTARSDPGVRCMA